MAARGYERLRQRVIAHIKRGNEPVALLGKFKRLPFLVAWERADFRHVFADQKRFAEAFGGAFDFVFLKQIIVGLHPFLRVAHRLVGQGIDHADCEWHPRFFHVKLRDRRVFIVFGACLFGFAGFAFAKSSRAIIEQMPVKPGA